MDVRNIVCQYITFLYVYSTLAKLLDNDDAYMLNEYQKSTYSRKKDDNTCLLNEGWNGLSLLKRMQEIRANVIVSS